MQFRPPLSQFFVPVLVMAALLVSGLVSAQSQTTLTLTAVALAPGESGVVEARIACGADGCAAFQITIEYDPIIIQVDRAELGPYLGTDLLEAENTVLNAAGVVRLAAVALAALPAASQPVLFRLHVTGLSAGSTPLGITDLLGSPVDTAAIDGAVVVGGLSAAVPTPTLTALTSVPCTVRTANPRVNVRVGPGTNRAARGWLPVGQDIPVVGWAADARGGLWWRIQPPNFNPAEADRYWVAQADVTTSGGCDQVAETSASAVISAPVVATRARAAGHTPTGCGLQPGAGRPGWQCGR